jgi:hypothetical protein
MPVNMNVALDAMQSSYGSEKENVIHIFMGSRAAT